MIGGFRWRGTPQMLRRLAERGLPRRAHSLRLSQRIGPVQLTLAHRATGIWLQASVWGTGLSFKRRLWTPRPSRRRPVPCSPVRPRPP